MIPARAPRIASRRCVPPLLAAILLCTYTAAGAAPVRAVQPAPASPLPGITVTGIVRGPFTLAIFRQNGYTYVAGVGELAGDYRVVAIRPGRVVVRRGAFVYALPTPVVAAAARPVIPPGAVLTVAGIVLARVRLAILRADGVSVVAGVGDRVGDAVVEAIRPRSVLIRRGAALFELPLAGLASP